MNHITEDQVAQYLADILGTVGGKVEFGWNHLDEVERDDWRRVATAIMSLVEYATLSSRESLPLPSLKAMAAALDQIRANGAKRGEEEE